MGYAIAGLVIFVIGVSIGLWCKRNVEREEAFNDGVEFGIGLGREFANRERGK